MSSLVVNTDKNSSEVVDQLDNEESTIKSKENQDDNVNNMWEFPFVYLFLKSFSEVTNYKMPYIEEFERKLVDNSIDFLSQLIIKMISFCSSSSVNKQNWEVMLNRLLKKHDLLYWDHSPLEDNSYENLSSKDKVKIFKCICDWLIELPNFFEAVNKPYDGVWRIYPLGKDRNNNLYWYFNDIRLYKEEIDPSKIKPKPLKIKKSGDKRKKVVDDFYDPTPPQWISEPPKWTLICKNVEDWENFVESINDSRNSDERKLYKEIVETILPKVKQKVINREKKARRLELLSAPPIKRSVRLQAKEIQRREEEKRREEMRKLEKQKNGEIVINGEIVDIADERQRRLLARQEKIERMKLLEEAKKTKSDETTIRIPKNALENIQNEEGQTDLYEENVKPVRNVTYVKYDYYDDDDDSEDIDDDDDDDFELETKKKAPKKRKWYEDDIEDEEYIKVKYENQKLERELRMKKRQERYYQTWYKNLEELNSSESDKQKDEENEKV